MNERKLFYLFGFIMFLIFSANLILMLQNKDFSLSVLVWLGLSYMFFVIGYIQPQTLNNDERSKYIKRKTLSDSMIIVIILILILTMLTQITNFSFSLVESLTLFVFLSTFTIFTMWIVNVKRN
ncbi:hypothetical protein ACTWQB_14480 [Piscibacillus sp. B03]|uniref:hypothetical protein n=1 Tax=Piscibacillus sp. B03 TaxID=3457430 RepID=UPI003FCD17EA